LNSVSRFEKTIGYLLITGVVISLILEILGISAYYGTYGHLDISERRAVFLHGQNFFNFVFGLFEGEYAQNKAILLMTLGITLLIFTPYLRVIISVVNFARKKDVKYLFITLFVFVILTISLAVH
jgi:uncharacterized membrane protein